MSKDKKYRETRKQLIEVSNIAKHLQKTENLDMNINEILLKIIYDTKDCNEFNTFWQWKEKGYTIIKGSKAFLIWGQPINKQKTEKSKAEAQDADEDEYRFFPVCYLFSDKQVFKKEVKTEEETTEKTENEHQETPEYLPL